MWSILVSLELKIIEEKLILSIIGPVLESVLKWKMCVINVKRGIMMRK